MSGSGHRAGVPGWPPCCARRTGIARVGVFCEYCRAADRAAATVRPDRSRVIDDPECGVAGFDAVETERVDPRLILGLPVAFVGDFPARSTRCPGAGAGAAPLPRLRWC